MLELLAATKGGKVGQFLTLANRQFKRAVADPRLLYLDVVGNILDKFVYRRLIVAPCRQARKVQEVHDWALVQSR